VELPETGDVPWCATCPATFEPAAGLRKVQPHLRRAQKNIGPAGVTAVVVRKSWLDAAGRTSPP
jgi:hypothetical protein